MKIKLTTKPPPAQQTPGAVKRAVDLDNLTALSSYQKWEVKSMAQTKKTRQSPRGQQGDNQDDGIIYARYSSHAQKDASIEQQIEECLKYAKEHGINIVGTYADRAVTGKTDRRADFQRMMKDAEKGHFHYVIAWKSNRIGRNMLQSMMNEARDRKSVV